MRKPDHDCALCPRLVEFRQKYRQAEPEWHNAPVPGFGSLSARLLVVGLAPGLKGANKSGLPFSGDGSGDLLYRNLIQFGFARGQYRNHDAAELDLHDCRITNAVRCVPPENRPTGDEANTCMPFLIEEIEAMPELKFILALGSLAHNRVLRIFGLPQKAMKFGHNAEHNLPNGITLYDSYHCSRYNLNTGRLTEDMFRSVFQAIRDRLQQGREMA